MPPISLPRSRSSSPFPFTPATQANANSETQACALGEDISTFVLGHAFQNVCMDSYGCVYAFLVLASLEEIRPDEKQGKIHMEMTYSLTTSSYESKYSDLQPIFAKTSYRKGRNMIKQILKTVPSSYI